MRTVILIFLFVLTGISSALAHWSALPNWFVQEVLIGNTGGSTPVNPNSTAAMKQSMGVGITPLQDAQGNIVSAGDLTTQIGIVALTAPLEAGMMLGGEGEAKGAYQTGLLRGGKEGVHYVSDAVNSDVKRAQQRLSLDPKNKYDVRTTLEVPKGKLSPPTKVKPDNGMPGGGTERTGTGKIPAKIIRTEEY